MAACGLGGQRAAMVLDWQKVRLIQELRCRRWLCSCALGCVPLNDLQNHSLCLTLVNSPCAALAPAVLLMRHCTHCTQVGEHPGEFAKSMHSVRLRRCSLSFLRDLCFALLLLATLCNLQCCCSLCSPHLIGLSILQICSRLMDLRKAIRGSRTNSSVFRLSAVVQMLYRQRCHCEDGSPEERRLTVGELDGRLNALAGATAERQRADVLLSLMLR